MIAYSTGTPTPTWYSDLRFTLAIPLTDTPKVTQFVIAKGDGFHWWFKDAKDVNTNKLHRTDGPAKQCSVPGCNCSDQWYLDGVQYTLSEWKLKVAELKVAEELRVVEEAKTTEIKTEELPVVFWKDNCWYSDKKFTKKIEGTPKAKLYARKEDGYYFAFYPNSSFENNERVMWLSLAKNFHDKYQSWGTHKRFVNLSRKDGPALIHPTKFHYYVNGKEYTKEEYLAAGFTIQPPPTKVYTDDKSNWFLDKECIYHAYDLSVCTEFVVLENDTETVYTDSKMSVKKEVPVETKVLDIIYSKNNQWYLDKECTKSTDFIEAKVYCLTDSYYEKPRTRFYQDKDLNKVIDGLCVKESWIENTEFHFHHWKKGGVHHRDNGPATVIGNGSGRYYWEGSLLSKEDWIDKGGKEEVYTTLYSDDKMNWYLEPELTNLAWDLKAANKFVFEGKTFGNKDCNPVKCLFSKDGKWYSDKACTKESPLIEAQAYCDVNPKSKYFYHTSSNLKGGSPSGYPSNEEPHSDIGIFKFQNTSPYSIRGILSKSDLTRFREINKKEAPTTLYSNDQLNWYIEPECINLAYDFEKCVNWIFDGVTYPNRLTNLSPRDILYVDREKVYEDYELTIEAKGVPLALKYYSVNEKKYYDLYKGYHNENGPQPNGSYFWEGDLVSKTEWVKRGGVEKIYTVFYKKNGNWFTDSNHKYPTFDVTGGKYFLSDGKVYDNKGLKPKKIIFKKGDNWYLDPGLTQITERIEAETYCKVLSSDDRSYFTDSNFRTTDDRYPRYSQKHSTYPQLRYEEWSDKKDGPSSIRGSDIKYGNPKTALKSKWVAEGNKEMDPPKVLYTHDQINWYLDEHCTRLAWDFSACTSWMYNGVSYPDKWTTLPKTEAVYLYGSNWYSDRKFTKQITGPVIANQYWVNNICYTNIDQFLLHCNDAPSGTESTYFWMGEKLSKEEWIAKGGKDTPAPDTLYYYNEKWYVDPDFRRQAWDLSACTKWVDNGVTYPIKERTFPDGFETLIDGVKHIYFNKKALSESDYLVAKGELFKSILYEGTDDEIITYFKDAELTITHNPIGPARIRKDGTMGWYTNGVSTKVVQKDNYTELRNENGIHNENGPARIAPKKQYRLYDLESCKYLRTISSEEFVYALNGKILTKEEWLKQTKKSILFKNEGEEGWFLDKELTQPFLGESPNADVYCFIRGTSIHYYAKPYYDNRHCLDGPASIEQNNSYQAWWKNGVRHRANGPSIIRGGNSQIEYYLEGSRYSTKTEWEAAGGKEDLAPTQLYFDGESWFLDSSFKNLAWDFSVCQNFTVNNKHFKDRNRGILHCETGPAVEGEVPEWWLNGIQYSQKDWNKLVNPAKSSLKSRILVNQLSNLIGKKISEESLSKNMVQYFLGHALKDKAPTIAAEARVQALSVLGNDFLNQIGKSLMQQDAIKEMTQSIEKPILKQEEELEYVTIECQNRR